MRIINVTNSSFSIPRKYLTNIPAKTISRNVVMTRELIKTYLVGLSNLYRTRSIYIVDQDEQLKFNDIFSVFPYINLRKYSDLVEFHPGDDVPPGSEIITDPFWFNVETCQTESKEFLVLFPEEMSTETVWENMTTLEDYDKVRFLIGTQDEYDGLLIKDNSILYFCIDTRVFYRGEVSMTAVNSIDDLSEVIRDALSDVGMTHMDVPTSKAVVDYINTRFETIIGGVEYRGLLDPNNLTLNPYWVNPRRGFLFRISAIGVIDGVKLGIGDSLIINKDGIVGEPTANDFDVIPYTLDEIGDLLDLKTTNQNTLVEAINEVYDNLPFWHGIDK